MQWLDALILVILFGSLLWGLKTGLLDVAFMCAGILAGWWLSARCADNVGELVSFSADADAFVSVLAYVFIMSVSSALFVMAGRVIKTIAASGTLGAVTVADRIAGVALGLVVGLTISGALIVILARLAFTFTGADLDIPGSGNVGVDSRDTSAVIEGRRQALIDLLSNSKAVSVFIDVWDLIPRISFGPVVGDFAVGLDLLSGEVNGDKTALSGLPVLFSSHRLWDDCQL